MTNLIVDQRTFSSELQQCLQLALLLASAGRVVICIAVVLPLAGGYLSVSGFAVACCVLLGAARGLMRLAAE
jgi:hypothetical protein